MRASLPVLFLCALLTAGCGGDKVGKESGPNPAATVSQSGEPEESNAKEYVEAINSGDIDTSESAIDMAAPGSAAQALAKYLYASLVAQEDGGMTDHTPGEVSRKGDGFEICYPQDEGDDKCVTWSDFKLQDGRVSAFSMNDKPVAGLVRVGDGTRVSAGRLGTVEFVAAYDGSPATIVYTVRSGDRALNVYAGSALMRAKSGRQSQAFTWFGPDKLQPHSTASFISQFKARDFGGSVTVELAEDGGNYETRAAKFDIE